MPMQTYGNMMVQYKTMRVIISMLMALKQIGRQKDNNMKKVIILTILLLFSCNEKQTIKKETPKYMKTIYFSYDSYMKYKKNALENGDQDSYKRLGLFYSYNPSLNYEYLPISIVMAEKYNLTIAYHNVYYATVKMYNNGIYTSYLFKNLNLQQREFALYYLQKCHEKGDLAATVELARIYKYGIGYKKDIKKAELLEQIVRKNSNSNYDFEKVDKIEMNAER
jgi:TPR repeat protein